MAQACPECGRESPDGFLHCGFCGAPLAAPVAGRRRLATLVFCDLVGSTALGERVDPESLQELLRRYFTEMREALERHGGSVEKFIGDAVVGVFGVPVTHEDDALRACRAALEMQARLTAVNAELQARFGAGIEARIGVNTGEVVGSRETFVTGDAVNTAARLEQAARPGEVLLGEPTYRLVRDAVRAEPVAPLEAKGKSTLLAAYRLLEAGAERTVRWETTLVGRGEELALLEREFEQAAFERRCRLVTIVGEPGVGKSRLAAELVERLGGRALTVRGACLSYGEGITFWALAQIVRELAGIRKEQSAEEARSRVPPRIAQLLGLAEGTVTAEQTTQAIAEFLAAAAVKQPLLVIVDDIQWAEPALLDLLAALPARLDAAPVVLCALARPELNEHRPDWPVTVQLDPLGAGEIDALLENLDALPATRVRLAIAAAGNPLFAEELVAWAREGGDADALPTSLNALLGARLDRLEANERDALERGAVEGELFHQAAIIELSDEPSRGSVPAELGQLARKDLIRLAAAGLVAGGVAYRFKHVLVREAAYTATAKKLRSALHERFADWLERVAGERVGEYHEILGYHFEQAYRYRLELGPVDDAGRVLAARAARHLGAGGVRADARGDYHAAENLLGRAVGLLPDGSLERVHLQRHYGGALNSLGRLVESAAAFEEVIEQAAALGERGLAARGRNHRVGQRIFADPDPDLAAERAIVEAGLETMEELGDEDGLAEHCRQLGLIARLEGRHAEAAVWLERALAHARVGGDERAGQMVTRSLAHILVEGPMPVGEATGRCEELYEENRDDRMVESIVATCLAALAAMASLGAEAHEYGRRAERVLGEANTMFAALGQATIARTRELLGDRDGARRAETAKWAFFQDGPGGVPDGRAIDSAVYLAWLACEDGRWEEAAEWLDRYRDVPEQRRVRVRRLAAEARLAAHRGDHAEAMLLARRAVEVAERGDNLNERAEFWLALAETQRAAGQTVEANSAVATALELYEQKGNVAAARRLRPVAPV